MIGPNATLHGALLYFQSRGLKPEWDIKREDELKKKQEAERLAAEAKAKKQRKIAELMPKKDETMAQKLENYGSIHSLLTKKVKKSINHGGLADKLEAWYTKHGMADKADDRPHLLELAAKYAEHPDLIFRRLALKYHVKD